MEPSYSSASEPQPADVDVTFGQPGARQWTSRFGAPTGPIETQAGNQTGSDGVDIVAGSPRPRGSAQSPNTPHLNTLRAGLNTRVAQVMSDLQKMGEPGKLAAQRIKQVWDDIRSYTPSAAYATISPVESASAIERNYFARAHWLTFLRNVLILLPLLLTWIALGLASFAYQQEVAHSPNDVNYPLLELWQRGFTLQGPGDTFSFSSFSAVAFVDAGLFVALIIVGMFADGFAVRARAMARSAQRGLEDVTMQICHYCAELRINESGFPDMQAWSEEIRGTITAAAAATQKASDSLRDMSGLATQFQSNVDTLSQSAQTVSTSAGALTGAVASMSASASAMMSAADSAATESKHSADALSAVLVRMNEFVQSSAGSAAEVRKMSAEIITGFTQANEAMRSAAQTVENAGQTMQSAAERFGGTPPERPARDDDTGGWLRRLFKRRRNTRRSSAPYPRDRAGEPSMPLYRDDFTPRPPSSAARGSYGPGVAPAPFSAPQSSAPQTGELRPAPPLAPPVVPPLYRSPERPIYWREQEEPPDGGDPAVRG